MGSIVGDEELIDQLEELDSLKSEELLALYQETKERRFRDQLVKNHMSLVNRICRKFREAREPMEDLCQIGVVGLLNAIDKFDLSRGIAFTSFAYPNIMGEILNFFRDHGDLVKFSRQSRRRSINVNKMTETMVSSLGRWPTSKEISEVLDLTEKDVLEALKLHYIAHDPRSLNEPRGGEVSLIDTVSDVERGFDEALDSIVIDSLVSTLPERERIIIHLRFWRNYSWQQIAERLEISQMHASRLEKRALQSLRKTVNGHHKVFLDAS